MSASTGGQKHIKKHSACDMTLFGSSKEGSKKEGNELDHVHPELEEIKEKIEKCVEKANKLDERLTDYEIIKSKIQKVLKVLEEYNDELKRLNGRISEIEKENKKVSKEVGKIKRKIKAKKEMERDRVVKQVEKEDTSYRVINVVMWILGIASIVTAIILGITYG